MTTSTTMTRAERVRRICDAARTTRHTLDLAHPDRVEVQVSAATAEACERLATCLASAALVGVALDATSGVVRGPGTWWVGTIVLILPAEG